eukprot:GHVT01068256.1.p2 GENE.GHVT01068256.1~~GHVT01068256.1.p2  ORF type:complete len:133 (-),score=46.46 GHVT01068256.1:1118-1516(-)
MREGARCRVFLLSGTWLGDEALEEVEEAAEEGDSPIIDVLSEGVECGASSLPLAFKFSSHRSSSPSPTSSSSPSSSSSSSSSSTSCSHPSPWPDPRSKCPTLWGFAREARRLTEEPFLCLFSPADIRLCVLS